MNKYFIFLLTIILMLTYGCNLEIPTSLSITGSPTIEIPGGVRSLELNAFWDIETQLDNIASGIDGLTRVQTQPGEPYELALNKEILNIAISDFVSETLNFQTINQTIAPQNVVIPSFILDTQTISTNIDPIAVPSSINLQPLNVSGIPEINGSLSLSEIIDSHGYSNVTFATGTSQVHIAITENVITPGLEINLTSAEILMPDDSLIISTNTPLPLNMTTNPTITFPLTGITFPETFKLKLIIDIANGGGFTEFFDLGVSFDFTNDTTILAANGIDIGILLNSSTTIPFNSGTEFVNAVIGTGHINTSLEIPATWSNISSTIDITLFQNATQIAVRSGPLPYTLDLSGLTFTNGELRAWKRITFTPFV